MPRLEKPLTLNLLRFMERLEIKPKSLSKASLELLGLQYTPTEVRWPARMQQLDMEPKDMPL